MLFLTYQPIVRFYLGTPPPISPCYVCVCVCVWAGLQVRSKFDRRQLGDISLGRRRCLQGRRPHTRHHHHHRRRRHRRLRHGIRCLAMNRSTASVSTLAFSYI